ncbi:MAG: AAA family ATPase, partial [Bacteroidales bacterium]|nr:AAA family ATPase [Bacteroidales bacterium]
MHNPLESLEIHDYDAGQLFSGKPSGTTIKGYAAPCAYTPSVDPDYLFHDNTRDLIVWFLNPIDPLYVFGPTGSGKTSCIKQLAARLNYPVFECNASERLEFSDLVGHQTIRE